VASSSWRVSKSLRFLPRVAEVERFNKIIPIFAKDIKFYTQYTTMASLRCIPIRWPVRGRNPTQDCRTSPRGKIPSHGTAAGPDGGCSCCPVPGVTFQPRQPQAPTADKADFKCYLAHPERLSDDELLRVLIRAKEIGALVCVHCENGALVDFMTAKLIKEGKTEPRWHPRSRPAPFEEEATQRAVTLAGMARTPLYVVHLTCLGALDAAKRAHGAGQFVLVETCPQYLLLDMSRYDEPGLGGAKYVLSPPLRESGNQEVLWRGLEAGDVGTVGTDHCPFNLVGQKDLGRDDFSKIPNGTPGIETRAPLLYHEGVNRGRVSLNRFVELVSANLACASGLLPQKGTIAVGSHADLAVWHPRREVALIVENLHMSVDCSPHQHIR
jgi:dihydropyrimidinase